jgi:hypothetical protein
VKTPNPAIVTQTSAQRLPVWALVCLCLVYVLTGLVNRDPWKNLDVASFGYMWELAQGFTQPWHPEIAGLKPELSGPLAYALGGAAISIFGVWFSPEMAARLPFILNLLLTLVATWYAIYFLAMNPHAQPVVFAFGGEAKPKDYAKAIADAGLLALIACLGMALPSHETTPIALQLCATAMLFCGAAFISTRAWLAVALFDFSLSVLALSGAPFLALILGIGIVFLVYQQQKKNHLKHLTMLVLGCLAVVVISTWADLWQWRLVSWEEISNGWKGLLRLLLWFTWPAWPLAAWTLWTWRNQWREHIWQQHLMLPVFIWSVIFIASITSKNPERTLLLSLPPLACLAAFALPTLKRSFLSLIDWFTLLFFTGGAVIVWVVWLSLQTGWPSQPALNVSRLIPGYVSVFDGWHTALAVVTTAIWCKLIIWRLARNPRYIWKSLVLPASGATLCWVLLMTLWMPLLNYARSYQPLALQVKSLIGSTPCIYSLGLNHAQIGGLSFHGHLKFQDQEKNTMKTTCTWLITNPEFIVKTPHAIDLKLWKQVKVIRRPADKREDIVIYQRTVPNADK